jgi:hypothetical protein
MIQDVYHAADKAHDTLHATTVTLIQDFNHRIAEQKDNIEKGFMKTLQDQRSANGSVQNTAHTPKTNSRFPFAQVNTHFHRSPNPYETTNSLPDVHTKFASHTINTPQACEPVPQTIHTGFHHPLPIVNHDQALKRAKIQFTELGDIFVFYNQLMNALEQFGIYLIPLNTVKYQVSLCPTHHNGIPIDTYRQQLMASTLYQKLQSSDVIPMEYTSIRNIINRCAESNDGYQVPYAMLELVHPALQTDAVISAPKSGEYDEDIHLYAQKFDAWLRYETYANRPYSPREQVNKFISELSPAFAPAVSRVR